MNKDIVLEFRRLTNLVSGGQFQSAYEGGMTLLTRVSTELEDSDSHHIMLFNLAGLFVDIGGMQPNEEATAKGLALLKDNEQEILEAVGKHSYFYYLSNAESNLLRGRDPFEESFKSVEDFVRLKNLFWKSVKYAEEESGTSPPQYKVNLANALRSQFRIIEALSYYDDVNGGGGTDIFESWVGRKP